VRAVVADGLLPVERIQVVRLRRGLRRFLGPAEALVPRSLLEWFASATRAVACWRGSSPMLSVDAAMRQLKCPALLVCGGQDLHVPTEAIDQLRLVSPAPTGLWLVPEAGHVRALAARPNAYLRRLTRFFVRHLARPSAIEAAHGRPQKPRRKAAAASLVAQLAHLQPSRGAHPNHSPRRPR